MPNQDPKTLHWQCLPFGALPVHTLYALLRLRAEVFVVEQACVFQDLDDADPDCLHLLGQTHEGSLSPLQAYARLVPAGLKFAEASIGRVITARAVRGSGLGHGLMQQAVHQLHQLWGVQAIRIGAQARLQDFYRQHGFEAVGAPYFEDGIAHIDMLRAAALPTPPPQETFHD
jgi:ElaA protein